MKKGKEMPQGQVKWFDFKEGYGFILSDETKADLFVHMKDVQKSGLETLESGQGVEYETKVKDDGKQYAKTIKILTTE